MRLGRVSAAAIVIVLSWSATAGAATKPPTKKDVAALQRSAANLGRLYETSQSFDGTQLLAATEAPFGAIAVGVTDGRISVWTTKDAKKWARVPETALGAPAEALDPASLGDSPLVDADADGAVVVLGSNVLATADGKRFTYAGSDGNGIPLRTEPFQVDVLTYGNAPPLDVAVGPKRSVLVGSGSWSRQAGGPSPSFVPTTWSSTDRTTWTGAPLKGANATPGLAQTVIALDDGGFVMAGTDTPAEVGRTVGRGDDAAVWTSGDGQNWTQTDPAPFGGPGTQEVLHLARIGERIVATGSDSLDGRAAAAAWTSADAGQTWTRVTLDPTVFPAGSRITGLVATPRGFVATGVDGASASTGRESLWVSPDGTTWTKAYTDRISSSAPTFMFPFGKEVVVVNSYSPYAGSANLPARPASTTLYITGAPPPKQPATSTTSTTRPGP